MHERWHSNHEATAVVLFSKCFWDGFATGGHFGNHFANDSADTGKRFFRGSCKPGERGKLCAQTNVLVVFGRPSDSIGLVIGVHGLPAGYVSPAILSKKHHS